MFGITSLFSNPSGMLTQLLYRIPAILVALSFHEWAHAYAAYKLGDPTARNMGRMTINPFAHIDPLGFLTLLLFIFTTGVNQAGMELFSNFFFLNISLCIFNLLPIPPLDGYHVAQCLFLRGQKTYRVFSFLERYGYIILLVLLFTGVLSTIMSPLVNGIVYGIDGIYRLLFRLMGLI